MGFSKPSVQLNWILDDAAGKYTIPSAPDQLLGHVSGTNADPKIFNWCWWRISQWLEFLDNTFDSNGNEVNAPKSTTITETVSPAASTVTLDAGGIKSWDGSSNAIFSVTEPGVVTIGYNGNDIISLTAGVLSVATATAADLVKLAAITPSAADINPLLGASGNGLVVADITKLAAITPSAADINSLLGASGNGLVVADITKLANIDASDVEIDQLDGVTVGGSSAGDIATINDTQTLTAKTIDADSNTISNLEHGSEVDDLTTGVHGVSGTIVGTSDSQTLTTKTIDADSNTISNLEHGSEVDDLTTSHGATGAIVGTTNTQTLTNKTLTSPKINEDVVMSATSSHLNRLAQSTYGLSITSGNTTDHGINISSITANKNCINMTANPGTTGSGISMDFSSAGGTGMKILNAAYAGIIINTTGTHGISLLSTVQNGIRLDGCGGVGYDSIMVLNQSNYGIQIDTPDGSHGHMRFIGVAGDPSTAEEGSFYYNSTAHTFVYYNGTAWKTLAVV